MCCFLAPFIDFTSMPRRVGSGSTKQQARDAGRSVGCVFGLPSTYTEPTKNQPFVNRLQRDRGGVINLNLAIRLQVPFRRFQKGRPVPRSKQYRFSGSRKVHIPSLSVVLQAGRSVGQHVTLCTRRRVRWEPKVCLLKLHKERWRQRCERGCHRAACNSIKH